MFVRSTTPMAAKRRCQSKLFFKPKLRRRSQSLMHKLRTLQMFKNHSGFGTCCTLVYSPTLTSIKVLLALQHPVISYPVLRKRLQLKARSDIYLEVMICFCWCGHRRVVEELSNYVSPVEDLCKGHLEEIHASRLKHYCDSKIDQVTTRTHGLQTRIVTVVLWLSRFEETSDGMFSNACLKGLYTQKDTLKPAACVCGDVLTLFLKMLDCKSSPTGLAAKVCLERALLKRKVQRII